MKITRATLVPAAVVALGLGMAPVASADVGPDCADIGHQVDTSQADPENLDLDGDGVGCESYPGPPEPLDDEDPELARTGGDEGIWLIAGGAAFMVAGGLVIASGRRRA